MSELRINLRSVSGNSLKISLAFAYTFSMLLFMLDADARRAVRVETEEQWGITPDECVGASPANRLLDGPGSIDIGLNLTGFIFFGADIFDSSFRIACQQSVPYISGAGPRDYFNGSSVATPEDNDLHPEGDTGIEVLIGANIDSSVKGIRYSFLDDLFIYQWVFLTFPNDITLVRLQGLNPLAFRDSIIRKGDQTYFRSSEWPTYFGEFFCFKDQEFLGVWDEVNFSGNNPLPGCSLENVGQRQPPPRPEPPKPDPAITVLPAISSLLLDDGCDQFPEISLNQPISGAWAASDRRSRTQKRFSGSFADYYVLESDSSQRFRITLDATDVDDPVDTYLVLRKECDTGGRVSLFNDDFGAGRNSLIDTGDLRGKYLIEATTYEGSTMGGYNLTVEPLN